MAEFQPLFYRGPQLQGSVKMIWGRREDDLEQLEGITSPCCLLIASHDLFALQFLKTLWNLSILPRSFWQLQITQPVTDYSTWKVSFRFLREVLFQRYVTDQVMAFAMAGGYKGRGGNDDLQLYNITVRTTTYMQACFFTPGPPNFFLSLQQ